MPAKVTFELYFYARGVDTPRWKGIDVFTGGHAPSIQGEQKIRSDPAGSSSVPSNATREPADVSRSRGTQGADAAARHSFASQHQPQLKPTAPSPQPTVVGTGSTASARAETPLVPSPQTTAGDTRSTVSARTAIPGVRSLQPMGAATGFRVSDIRLISGRDRHAQATRW